MVEECRQAENACIDRAQKVKSSRLICCSLCTNNLFSIPEWSLDTSLEHVGSGACLAFAGSFFSDLMLFCHILHQLTSLELQYVSPKLLMCRDLELAVPGTYDPNQPIIRIQSIAPSLQVITSKQRPRKLTIMGKTSSEPLQHTGLGK